MKNREYQKIVAAALTAALVLGGSQLPAIPVWAQEKVQSASGTKQQATTRKDETVYVKLDASGNIRSVTVSDQLKNISGLENIKDVSELENIENVKGDETFSRNQQGIVWEGDGQDIVYQGTTTKELPVGVQVTYMLDGKKVEPSELQGKSGHLVIQYNYENKTGENNTSYTPFLMVTGLILNTEKFSNVTVENGKIISDGERNLAIGMGIPKLKDELCVEDINLPDYFTIEADVVDYDGVEGITVATNEIFN